jgi:hypothetical protein
MPTTLPTQMLPCRRCAMRLPPSVRTCDWCGITHPHAPTWGVGVVFGLMLLLIVISRVCCR